MSELGFTEAEIEHMLTNLDAFSLEEVAEIDKLVDERSDRLIDIRDRWWSD